MDPEQDLQIRLERDLAPANLIQSKSAVIKRGPQAWKTAQVADYGVKDTGEVKTTTLVLKSFARKKVGVGYAFEDKPQRWSCDGAEIAALREFLLQELPGEGRYTVVREDSIGAVVERLAGDAAQAAKAIVELLQVPEVRAALASNGGLDAGSTLVQRQQRLAVLYQLEEAALAPETLEQVLQDLLDQQWWLFGARYVDQHTRRRFTALDEFDLPLRRADGSLHVVELKRAYVPKLIEPYRNHYIVGRQVHEAVGQAMNYLQALDESAHALTVNLGIDVRRVDATVVIGHSSHLSPDMRATVAQTLRTYNSHLARVQVVTYDELIDGARAALEPAELEHQHVQPATQDLWTLPGGVEPWEDSPSTDPWDDEDPF